MFFFNLRLRGCNIFIYTKRTPAHVTRRLLTFINNILDNNFNSKSFKDNLFNSKI